MFPPNLFSIKRYLRFSTGFCLLHLKIDFPRSYLGKKFSVSFFQPRHEVLGPSSDISIILDSWIFPPPWRKRAATMIRESSVIYLCDPMNCSLPGSSINGVLLARILEWIVISSSRGSSQPKDQTHISCVSSIDRWTLPQSHPGKPW